MVLVTDGFSDPVVLPEFDDVDGLLVVEVVKLELDSVDAVVGLFETFVVLSVPVVDVGLLGESVGLLDDIELVVVLSVVDIEPAGLVLKVDPSVGIDEVPVVVSGNPSPHACSQTKPFRESQLTPDQRPQSLSRVETWTHCFPFGLSFCHLENPMPCWGNVKVVYLKLSCVMDKEHLDKHFI